MEVVRGSGGWRVRSGWGHTVAIEGTHASGKTTLIHALTAYYRRRGVNVAAMGEPPDVP